MIMSYLWIVALVCCVGAYATRRLPFVAHRGGGAGGYYTAVGTIHGDESHVFLTQQDINTTLQQQHDENNATAMATAIGMTCNVIVIRINNSNDINSSTLCLEALRQGLERSGKALGHKATIIVVAEQEENNNNAANNDDNVTARLDMRDVLVSGSGPFHDWTPDWIERLELVSNETQLQNVLQEVVQGDSNESLDNQEVLVDAEAFPVLLKNVYCSIAGVSKGEFEWKVETISAPKDAQDSETSYSLSIEETAERNNTQDVDEKNAALLKDSAGSLLDESVLLQQVIAETRIRMDEIQAKLENIWLHADDNDNGATVPLLEFGRDVNNLLEHAMQTLDTESLSLFQQFQTFVKPELQRLHQDQLTSLRDFYGLRYEFKLLQQDGGVDQTQEARATIASFRQAAQESVPLVCRSNQPLEDWMDLFDYTSTLEGLISDMMQATSNQDDDEALEEEEAETKHLPPWVKKLASRAIVLAINYFQGWLAWQAVRRAAMERDREMPKFPLF